MQAAEKQIDRDVFGFTVPTPWVQSLNPLFIVILAPIMSALWYKLGSSKRGDFRTPTKMAMGLITVGLGILLLVLTKPVSKLIEMKKMGALASIFFISIQEESSNHLFFSWIMCILFQKNVYSIRKAEGGK